MRASGESWRRVNPDFEYNMYDDDDIGAHTPRCGVMPWRGVTWWRGVVVWRGVMRWCDAVA